MISSYSSALSASLSALADRATTREFLFTLLEVSLPATQRLDFVFQIQVMRLPQVTVSGRVERSGLRLSIVLEGRK